MSGSDVRLVVSVQARGFEDVPWEGHLVTGFLIAPDEVVVPAGAEVLTKAADGIDLLVLPLAPDSDHLDPARRLERLAGVRVRLVPTGKGDKAGNVTAANASRYRPDRREVTRDEFNRALAAHDHDVWAALEDLGVVETGLRDAVTDELLRAVPAAEDAWRRPVFEDLEDGFPGKDPMICEHVGVCRGRAL
ncbi:hypothetical protein [Saccharothrix xinjiangensis]|uniref:Uncharacterized protein n=1 Tax=Saccharothrix xinjiangensis TaxID=204798 RepID=A0ABV9Y5T0_9PSEU